MESITYIPQSLAHETKIYNYSEIEQSERKGKFLKESIIISKSECAITMLVENKTKGIKGSMPYCACLTWDGATRKSH